MIITSLLPLVLAGQAAAAATPPKPIDPNSWMAGTAYPADARARHEQGKVGFTVEVDQTGRVTNCRITTSSGSKSLDSATCATVSAKARFTPAHDASGKNVAGHFSSTSNWALGGAGAKQIDLTKGGVRVPVAAIEVALDSEGKVTGCKALKTARANATPCKEFPNGRQLTAPLRKAGKPVSGTYTILDSIIIKPNAS